jgi:catalase-peroxidase
LKQKYETKFLGLICGALAGNVALESSGFKHLVLQSREDVWRPNEDIYWGSEREWLGDNHTMQSVS